MLGSFTNDYSRVGHPAILEALSKWSGETHTSYGLDRHSRRAAELIRGRFGCPEADVHLLAGGTITNLTAISSFLRPHQAVIAVENGHIFTFEGGAIEATGHKIVTRPSADGLLRPEDIEAVLAAHAGDDHMVKPTLVYISNASELGTVYSRASLVALRRCCHEHGLLLYLDGARLGAALASPVGDLLPEDVAAHTDAFYIGGTKNGLLFGEALVLVNPRLREDFRYLLRQRGAMLAKGFVAGIQFEALFDGDLFFDLARHADAMAERLAAGLKNLGCRFLAPVMSNQVFPILANPAIEALKKDFSFYVMGFKDGNRSSLRLVTSWETDVATVDAFIERVAAVGAGG